MDNYLETQLLQRDSDRRRSRTKKRLACNYGSIIEPYKEAAILDIGPGRGEMIEWLKNEMRCKYVTAIDINIDVVDYINRTFGECAVHVEDPEEYLNSRQERYSVVTMMHVLEHIDHDVTVRLLTSVRAALKPGGILIIEVPNSANIFVGSAIQSSDFTHRVAYTSVSLRQVLLMSGFDEINLYPVRPPGISPLRLMQRSIIRIANLFQHMMTKIYLPSETFLHDATIYAVASVRQR